MSQQTNAIHHRVRSVIACEQTDVPSSVPSISYWNTKSPPDREEEKAAELTQTQTSTETIQSKLSTEVAFQPIVQLPHEPLFHESVKPMDRADSLLYIEFDYDHTRQSIDIPINPSYYKSTPRILGLLVVVAKHRFYAPWDEYTGGKGGDEVISGMCKNTVKKLLQNCFSFFRLHKTDFFSLTM